VDIFLRSIKDQLDKREYTPSSNVESPEGVESLRIYLDQMILRFAREAKKRQTATEHPT
jgi:hypothetical protein